ncbi:MAG: hypothetical protein AAGL29_06015 [Bacteroidota bacterium]
MTRFLLPLLGLLVFQSCAQKPWYGDLKFEGKFPSKLSEVSGMEVVDGQIWVIEDNGNKDVLYRVGPMANLIQQLKVKDAKNQDWEDLAHDTKGNLYIGDFGNNSNQREDLCIYKVPNPSKEKGDKIQAQRIRFSYPEQKKFPPKDKNLLFDCEAFFHHNNTLYLITKNRAHPYTGKALVYSIPDTPGKHKAKLIGEFTSCAERAFCSITGAAISPSGEKVVLLGSGYIWLFTDFPEGDFTKGKMEQIDVLHRTQQESICFKDETTLLIADEQSKTKGRNLYSYSLQKD